MLKIHQSFIVRFLFLFVGTLLVASLIGYIVLKSVTQEQYKKNLQNLISLIELNHVENLQEYVKKLSKTTEFRVTMISEDGTVLAESLSDVLSMDNHSARYEISQANKDFFSYSVRESKTLKSGFLYVAKKVTYKDEQIYIRLSINLDLIMSEFYSLFLKLFLLFFLVFLIAFYISKRMTDKIVFDIEQITNYLDEVTRKNYSYVIKTEYFYEFLEISLKLKNIVKRLHSKDKQKRKNNKLS